MKQKFTFEIAGNISDGRLMVLVDDELYGQMAYLINDISEDNKIDYEIKIDMPPEERQQRILTAIVKQIVTESREL